jgi:alkylation response protein AidB-like acyl-CoA dehydrogenase
MTTSTTETPPREALVQRAADLKPLLRSHAPWQEQNRRLHDEVVEALADAGLFRLRVPAHRGGYEVDARTLHAVLTELARGDGSVAWTTSVWAIPGWMVGMFSDEAQDEVYATPDVRVCGTLSPTAAGRPVDGGMVVNGQWHAISGAWHSQWQEIIAMAPAPDGVNQWPVMALVPTSDLKLVDDWHTSGLCGSGSITTVAEEVFVPQHRIVPLPAVMQGQTTSVRNAEVPMYRNPLLAVANASSAGTPLGLAQAALELFLERLDGRRITYTDYERQQDAAVTHLQVAEATMRIDEAGFHADRITSLADERAVSGEPWSLEERARTRADIGATCRLSKEAVTILSGASGASSLYTRHPMQRIVRDMHAVNLHALMVPETNSELYGRVLVGLPPNSMYV